MYKYVDSLSLKVYFHSHFLKKYMLMPLLFPYALSVPADCPAVIKLAASLNMPYTQMIKLNSNCCTATDLVTCEGSRVTHLTWASLGLYGTINTSLVFPTLLTLDLSSNLFSGPLPLLVESTTLLGLDLSGNKFNGTIPTISSSFLFFSLYFNSLSGVIPAIPSSVEYLFLDSNFLTGTIPLLPSALTQVWLSFNLLTGSIPGLPSALEVLYFDSNFLTGTIPPIPPTVAEFGVSYNLLSGVVPALSSYQMSYVYLQGNRLSGKLSVNEPIDLLINNNYISDVVVQSVISLNATACDLSNNPLLGNSRIQNLVTKGCKVLGLYAESLLPFTLTTSISKRSSHSSLLTTAAMSKTSTNDAKTFSTSTTYKTISSAYARTISSSPNGPYLVSTLVHTHAAVAPLGSVTIKIPWTSSRNSSLI